MTNELPALKPRIAVLIPCYNTSFALGLPLFLTYFETVLVPRLPTALLSTGLMLSAMLSLVCGAILNTVTMSRHEIRHLAYLSVAAPSSHRGR